jgi:hypothetical protein
MYSGKIAVPPGGSGIVEIIINEGINWPLWHRPVKNLPSNGWFNSVTWEIEWTEHHHVKQMQHYK